tara:strand:- start:2422 stop:2673 length:252 start_codon:yes stop_codon:yes gene_type:complete
MKEKLFSKNRVRILNLLIEHLQDFDDVYSLSFGRLDIRLQGHFNGRIVSQLHKRKFKVSVSDMGVMYMSKVIADIELVFIFTD